MNGSLDVGAKNGDQRSASSDELWVLLFEAPGNKIAGVEGDAKEIGGERSRIALVRIPITQTTALLIPAMTQPCQSFLPISTVARTVKTQDR